MNQYIFVILGLHVVSGAPPLKLTIDCGSPESQELKAARDFSRAESRNIPSPTDVQNICSIIQSIVPKSGKDTFKIRKIEDQERSSNDWFESSLPPRRPLPKFPKFRPPRVKVPKFKVPTLKPVGPLGKPKSGAPKVGAPMIFKIPLRARDRDREESSAEKMEKFKKGVQKMLHVVKVLGQIDQYVSERTRSIVEILSRTVSE